MERKFEEQFGLGKVWHGSGLLHVFVIGTFLFLSGCGMDSADSIAPAASLSVASAKKGNPPTERPAVPFKATFNNTFEILNPPPVLLLLVTGTGTGSHIGKASLTAYLTKDFTNASPDDDVPESGNIIMTAANGDQLFMDFTGTTFAPDVSGISEVLIIATVTGGTGRFEDATGSLEGRGYVNPASFTGSLSFTGTISY